MQDANKVYEFSIRYDDIRDCEADWQNPKTCEVTLEITEDLDAPIFVYYEVRNMYQNHRLYTKSRDPKQLMGATRTYSEIETNCDPIITMEDLGLDVNISYTSGQVASPCGLIARSYFNDTFSLLKPQTYEPVEILQDGIAWPIEKSDKFIHQENWQTDQWIDVENEHFMVWMGISALPDFRKLWGRIEEDLDSGKYKVAIESLYDVQEFNGEKHIILSTTGTFGGKVTFIGIAYVAVGVAAVIGGFLFVILHSLKRRLTS